MMDTAFNISKYNRDIETWPNIVQLLNTYLVWTSPKLSVLGTVHVWADILFILMSFSLFSNIFFYILHFSLKRKNVSYRTISTA